MKVKNPSMMTNRELFTRWEGSKKSERYPLVEEMTKRLGWKMITNDVVPVFSQYKLNGAGDQYK